MLDRVRQMSHFQTNDLPQVRDAIAPDGSDVRILLALRGGSMAHFELAAGQTSTAVVHATVEEIWFFLAGQGELWRRVADDEETARVRRATCLTIPVGTAFQFRASGHEPLEAIGVTMPPWPGDGDARVVEGTWRTTVP